MSGPTGLVSVPLSIRLRVQPGVLPASEAVLGQHLRLFFRQVEIVPSPRVLELGSLGEVGVVVKMSVVDWRIKGFQVQGPSVTTPPP